MEQTLVYGAYAVAGVLALAVYLALPNEGRAARRGAAVVVSAVALGSLLILLGRLLGESGGGRAYFYVLSLLAVLGGIRVVTHAKPVYSALYFILVVLSTAAMIVMAGAEFLAAALVIVYAGAILVTYVFVIMMAQQSRSAGTHLAREAVDYDRSAREPAAAVLAGFVLVATLAGVISARSGGSAARTAAQAAVPQSAATVRSADDGGGAAGGEGNTMQVARALLLEDGFPVSLQVAGVLLMVAMVGAIAIAQRRIPRAEEPAQELPLGEIGKRVKPF